jgi:hypothetical protein
VRLFECRTRERQGGGWRDARSEVDVRANEVDVQANEVTFAVVALLIARHRHATGSRSRSRWWRGHRSITAPSPAWWPRFAPVEGAADNFGVASEIPGRLRFGVLGPLAVWRDGEPVRLGGERQRALLALLLIQANELVGVETLIEPLCLAGLGCVAARNEDASAAGRLWTLAQRLEHEIGFRMVAAERVRYERNLTPPLTNTDEYRAGIADAANIDPLTAAAEIVNR